MNFKYYLMTVMAAVCLCTVLTGSYAVAEQGYDIKEMTPAVKAALDNRRARYNELLDLKNSGVIGENAQGYVEVLGSDTAKQLVDAENKDRKTIYTTIVEQNNLPSDALATVEKVFAQVQRDKATAGHKIQDTDGSWKTK